MFKELRPALVSFLALSVITGVAYPLLVTAFAQLFPSQATGSVIEVGGKAVGSALIGQPFSDAEVLLGPSVGDLAAALQRRLVLRLEPGPYEQGPRRRRRRPRQGAEGSRPGQHQTRASRPRHGLRQRSRSAHQPRRRRLPGRARGARAQAAPRRRCASWSRRTPRAAPSACSASRASTCCASTSPSTR